MEHKIFCLHLALLLREREKEKAGGAKSKSNRLSRRLYTSARRWQLTSPVDFGSVDKFPQMTYERLKMPFLTSGLNHVTLLWILHITMWVLLADWNFIDHMTKFWKGVIICLGTTFPFYYNVETGGLGKGHFIGNKCIFLLNKKLFFLTVLY